MNKLASEKVLVDLPRGQHSEFLTPLELEQAKERQRLREQAFDNEFAIEVAAQSNYAADIDPSISRFQGIGPEGAPGYEPSLRGFYAKTSEGYPEGSIYYDLPRQIFYDTKYKDRRVLGLPPGVNIKTIFPEAGTVSAIDSAATPTTYAHEYRHKNFPGLSEREVRVADFLTALNDRQLFDMLDFAGPQALDSYRYALRFERDNPGYGVGAKIFGAEWDRGARSTRQGIHEYRDQYIRARIQESPAIKLLNEYEALLKYNEELPEQNQERIEERQEREAKAAVRNYADGGEAEKEYLYGVGPEGSGIGQLLSPLLPIRREVIEPYQETFIESPDPGQMERVVTPGQYGEAEFAVPQAVQAFMNFKGLVRDPEAREAVLQGIAALPELPAELSRRAQMSTQAALEGEEQVYDPQTGSVVDSSEVLLTAPLLTAPGTAASIAMAGDKGGTVLGIMGGSKAQGPVGDRARKAEDLAKRNRTDKGITAQTGAVRSTENKFVVPIEFAGDAGFSIKPSVAEEKGKSLLEAFDPTGGFSVIDIEEDFGPVALVTEYVPRKTKRRTESKDLSRGPLPSLSSKRKNLKTPPKVSDFIDFERYFAEYPEVANLPVYPATQLPRVGDWKKSNLPAVQYDPVQNIFYAKMDVGLFGDARGVFDYRVFNGDAFALALQSYVSHKEGLVLPEGVLTKDLTGSNPVAGEISPKAKQARQESLLAESKIPRMGSLSSEYLMGLMEQRQPALTQAMTMPTMYADRAKLLTSEAQRMSDKYAERASEEYSRLPPAAAFSDKKTQDAFTMQLVERLLNPDLNKNRPQLGIYPLELRDLATPSEELPFNSNIGTFESRLLFNAKNLKQEKVKNGDQFLNILLKDAPKEELQMPVPVPEGFDHSYNALHGFEGDQPLVEALRLFLTGRKNVTKQEVIDFLEQRQVPISQLETDNFSNAQLDFVHDPVTGKLLEPLEGETPKIDAFSQPTKANTIEFLTEPDRRFVGEMGYESVLPRHHSMEQGNFGWVRFTNRNFQDEDKLRPSKVIEEIQSDIHQKAKATQGDLLNFRVRKLVRGEPYPRNDRLQNTASGLSMDERRKPRFPEVKPEEFNDKVIMPAAQQTMGSFFDQYKNIVVARMRKQGTSEEIIEEAQQEIDGERQRVLNILERDPEQIITALERGLTKREFDFILPDYMINEADLDNFFLRKTFDLRQKEQMRRAYPKLSEEAYADVYDPRFEDAATGIKGIAFAPLRTSWHKLAIQTVLKEALDEGLEGLALTTTRGSRQKTAATHSQYDAEYLAHLKEIAKRFNLRLEAVNPKTNKGGLSLIQVDQGDKPDISYHYLYLDNPGADIEGLEEFLATPIRTGGKPLAKATGGGVGSMAPVATNMFRGYDDVRRGVGAYAPLIRRA